MKCSIRDLFLLTLIVALAAGWWVELWMTRSGASCQEISVACDGGRTGEGGKSGHAETLFVSLQRDGLL